MTSNIMVERKCPMCGNIHSALVSYVGYMRWKGGELIQHAMPEATPTEREQLISGICPDCQEIIFGDFED